MQYGFWDSVIEYRFCDEVVIRAARDFRAGLVRVGPSAISSRPGGRGRGLFFGFESGACNRHNEWWCLIPYGSRRRVSRANWAHGGPTDRGYYAGWNVIPEGILYCLRSDVL